MGEKNNVFDRTIKYKGFFNFRDLYNFCFNWLKNEKYNLSEDEYTEKIQPEGKEVVIKWTAKKKVSDYFREIIEIKWHILQLTDAEVIIEGKKVKTNKGDLKIKISADLEKDYEDAWSKTPFYKFLRATYEKYVIKNTTDLYEDRLKDNAVDFFEDVKAFLNLEAAK
ncbi:MAG: hypothetical protein QW273_02325 [Candidatus Pacearchaeota archaeon]